MRDRRLRHHSVYALRRGFVAAAVLAYVAAAVGVRLPTGGGKDRSVPFPCMDRPCGCHDAEGCKEHCCCFTSEQKLAWAAEHQVDPTPFVNFAAPGSAVSVSSGEHDAACCASDSHQPETPARHCNQQIAATPPVRQNHCVLDHCVAPPDADDGSSRPTADLPDGADDSISIAAYRACHGLAPLWSTLGAALPPPQPTAYEFLWDRGESVAPVLLASAAFSLSPPTPPPRG